LEPPPGGTDHLQLGSFTACFDDGQAPIAVGTEGNDDLILTLAADGTASRILFAGDTVKAMPKHPFRSRRTNLHRAGVDVDANGAGTIIGRAKDPPCRLP
jgi:hypothetical protein